MNDLSSLVERAQCGDTTAYTQLVQRFQAMAIGYGYTKLGDQQLAELSALTPNAGELTPSI